MNVKDRILKWLEELKEKGTPVEAIGFYQELPVRVKTKVIDFDDKFVQWEPDPKLCMAAAEDGKLFFSFFDPFYQEKRIVQGDVTYYGNSFIETTLPHPSSDPRFNREMVRVKTSPSLPVKLFVLGENGEKVPFTVIDVSEGGVGVIGKKGSLKMGQPLKLELQLPNSTLCLTGEVTSVENYDEEDKFAIKLAVKSNERKVLRDYIMARQKEILSKLRDIAG